MGLLLGGHRFWAFHALLEMHLGQALVGEMKKGENAAGSVGHFFGARSGRLHSKSGTASKSRPFMKYLRVGR
ncbi:hypothetical protein EDM54_05745 [Brevibacillus borstelensis]|nr:hypothetical protein X546_19450 [Brevibacillus borstelensis cifa_chp40]RNB64750.1 hypothetical protein EDM54_05745 [Brevibacillus borstelensis]